MLKYIISFFTVFLFLYPRLYGQSKVLPSYIRIGTDLGRLAKKVMDPDRFQYEITSDIDVYKFMFTADYGYGETNLSEMDFDYSMNGSYFRLGGDYNLLFSDPDDHVIFFGIKYARSRFDETFHYTIQDAYYGNDEDNAVKEGNSAGWMEANVGMKVKIWKQLYLGWTGRLKFGLSVDAPGSFATYEIPGYGLASKTSRWGLSYNLYYRLVFREKPRILPVKKEKAPLPETTE